MLLCRLTYSERKIWIPRCLIAKTTGSEALNSIWMCKMLSTMKEMKHTIVAKYTMFNTESVLGATNYKLDHKVTWKNKNYHKSLFIILNRVDFIDTLCPRASFFYLFFLTDSTSLLNMKLRPPACLLSLAFRQEMENSKSGFHTL